jgi:hypothetical protein
MTDDDDDTKPDSFKVLSQKYADAYAECVAERRITNLHLETISRRLAFAPRSYPFIIAAVSILLGLRLIDLVHRFVP